MTEIQTSSLRWATCSCAVVNCSTVQFIFVLSRSTSCFASPNWRYAETPQPRTSSASCTWTVASPWTWKQNKVLTCSWLMKPNFY